MSKRETPCHPECRHPDCDARGRKMAEMELELARLRGEVAQLKEQRDDLQRGQSALVVENRGLRSHMLSTYETHHVSQVASFMWTMDQPARATPGLPNEERDKWIRLRVELCLEEAFELAAACFNEVQVLEPEGTGPWTTLDRLKRKSIELVRNLPVEVTSLPHIADALADLQYVTTGAFLTFGIDPQPVLDEVHRANMAKTGGPIDPVTGKKLKPEGWTPPDIESVLKKQGWVP